MNYDVVIFSLFRTDNSYSSISLSMAKELAKTCRVFYVNHPYSLKDLWLGLFSGTRVFRSRLPAQLAGKLRYERLDTIPGNFIAVQPPPTLPVNWLPKGPVYDFFQRINNKIVMRAIRRVIRDHDIRNFLYINCYNPFFAGWLPKETGALLSIYHCIDDITQDPYTVRHGFDLEREAIRHAGITLVTSTRLRELKSGLTDPGRLVTFFNAADFSVFEKAATQKLDRPAALDGRNGKVIGYIGHLDGQRIDYALLETVARAYSDCTLLLVGPYGRELKQSGIDRLGNVVCTGSRPLNALPPYLQHMDCVLIPFRCNTLTESIYPLKINEYLAAGKPVVSTAFSADIRNFADCIYLAGDHREFVRMIDRALREDDPALVRQRMEKAGSNSWEARIDQLREIVENATVNSMSYATETL